MPYFYHADLTIDTTELHFSPEEAHHIRRVFRKQPGEQISITNGAGLLALASIEYQHGVVRCRIQEVRETPRRTEQQVTIALSTIRPNRMDWAVEKLTELGVDAIQPLWCHHTTIRTFKAKHLQKIAISAIKQSEQTYLPQIFPPLELMEWVNSQAVRRTTCRYIAHRADPAPLWLQHRPAPGDTTIIAIGPEGGFSETEIKQLISRNFLPVKLAEQILRTETAAVLAAGYFKCPIK